ncbi:RfeD protein [Moelleriella libera RCEF 2490]|uniref:RfeD protein n=1 Tax=Moelleriella libera RCEF 2490 TaxID=1081109 RepID=A0A166UH91_9HYPO|nr:RfeD protein [Moelleriella libera RCEF 2490]
MQEHIRRAHPEHYIPKLPATEESFLLMINTPPQERTAEQTSSSSVRPEARDQRKQYRDGSSNPATPRNSDEYTTNGRGSMLGTASAAAALAELHSISSDRERELDGGYYSDSDGRRIPRTSIELPPLHLSGQDITSDPYSANSSRQREVLPSLLNNSPPGRSSTLPPLQRPVGPNRPRKQSITKRGREVNHKKKNSRGSAADWLRRIQNEDRFRPGNDRKALSAEPSADYGKRWEDLIDAADQAASAAGDLDEDRTPVPQSPVSIHRSSLPPFSHQHFQPSSYQASPLQQALTPPSYNQDSIDPFPSVENGEGGENFHIGSHGLSNSSPNYPSSQNTQIYCAACQSISPLKNSYACTECICGLCSTCVEVLMAEHGARRKCPRCATIGGRFKPFQLDIR